MNKDGKKVIYAFASDPRKEYFGKNNDYGFSGEIKLLGDEPKYKCYLNCVADGIGSYPNSGRDAYEVVNFIINKLSKEENVDKLYEDDEITKISVKKLLDSWKDDLTNVMTGGGTTFCGQILIAENAGQNETWTLICINVGDSYLAEFKLGSALSASYTLVDFNSPDYSNSSPSHYIKRDKKDKCEFNVKVERLNKNDQRVFLAFTDGVFSSEEKKSSDNQTPIAKQYLENYPFRLWRIYQESEFFNYPSQVLKESYGHIDSQNSEQKFDNATVAVMGFNIPAERKVATELKSHESVLPINPPNPIAEANEPPTVSDPPPPPPKKKLRGIVISSLLVLCLVILGLIIYCLCNLGSNKNTEKSNTQPGSTSTDATVITNSTIEGAKDGDTTDTVNEPPNSEVKPQEENDNGEDKSPTKGKNGVEAKDTTPL